MNNLGLFDTKSLRKLIRENLKYVSDLEDKREIANKLRERDAWKLDKNCPVQGLEAHAVLKHLIDNEGADPDSMDVYDIFPSYEYYKMTHFEVISGNEFGGFEFICGDEYDTEDTAKEQIEEDLNEFGFDGISKSVLENSIDIRRLRTDVYDFFNDWVSSEPEEYIDGNKRELSIDQAQTIEVLDVKIKKLEENINYFTDINLNSPNDKIEKKIRDIEKNIIELKEEVESILESPEGYFSGDVISDAVDELYNNYKDNPVKFLYDYGLPLKDYVDKRALAEEIFEHDGISLIRSYDGEANEIKISKTLFYVFRF
jgi:hypothetical protein